MKENGSSLILIVDDNIENRMILKLMMEKKGYQTAEAKSGHEAIAFSQERTPDLILLDIMMPVMDGFETCRKLRKIEETARIPVIFVTSLARSESIEKAFEAGGSDYITKPFIQEEVFARINLHIRLKLANKKVLDTVSELEKSRDDLQAILNQMRVGTIIIDADGIIHFISESCNEIEGLNRKKSGGRHWKEVLPLSDDSIEQLSHIISLPPEERNRATLIFQSPSKKTNWLEVEVKEDPRYLDRSIIYLYDMTEVHTLRSQIRQSNYVQIVGNSPAMLRMFEMFEQVAEGDWTVLIEGETGSGKELVARSIHATSGRRDGPFIAVNCAGLSDTLLASQLFGHRRGSFTGAVADQAGFFEAAEKGTLFLDEIGDIPMSMQASLLRALQEHEVIRIGDTQARTVDVRILTATNKDLGTLVEQGLFREDLLYRIRVARIKVPSLRERPEDIPVLLNTFLSERRIAMGKPTVKFDTDALRILTEYSWPGNVRELKNTVDHCIIHCRKSVIQPECLPDEIKRPQLKSEAPLIPTPEPPPADLVSQQTWEDDETNDIMAALRQARGNRSRAAKLLGISRATFYRKLDKLNIQP